MANRPLTDAVWVQALRDSGTLVASVFIGAFGESSRGVSSILRTLCQQVLQWSDPDPVAEPSGDVTELNEQLAALLQLQPSDGPSRCIVLDALDQISEGLTLNY